MNRRPLKGQIRHLMGVLLPHVPLPLGRDLAASLENVLLLNLRHLFQEPPVARSLGRMTAEGTTAEAKYRRKR